MKKAYYDNYDYPKYWKTRDYEHESECIAIKSFFKKLPKVETIAEVGCGFGRLSKCYSEFAKSITLIDPSGDLLKIAKEMCGNKKFHYKKSTVESLSKGKIKEKYDVIIMVRVLHHIDDLDKAFESINKSLKKNGYFILEFANKMHGKSQFENILKGNWTYPLDIFPVDKRSKKNIKKKSILFLNHHPDMVIKKLKENGFEILERKSVSNFRSRIIKKFIPLNQLLRLERKSQDTLAPIMFGPSIFVLCKKR